MNRILITGGTGFLGQYVFAAICGLLDAIITPIGRRHFDLTNQATTHEVVQQIKPDTVIHLAALVGGIGANQERPGDFFYQNMAMGINVLEACRLNHVKKVVVVGTVCSYPKHTIVPFMEEDIWNGYPEPTNAPYGIAKRALLVMGQAYRQQYGMNIIYLIPTNLYGPGDNDNLQTSHVIPALVKKFTNAVKNGETAVTVWGSGYATREFLHVSDAARAIALATRDYNGSEPINIGGGDEVSIRELASLIAELAGYGGKIEYDHTKPDGQPKRAVRSDFIKLMGWRPQITLRDGLRELVELYQA